MFRTLTLEELDYVNGGATGSITVQLPPPRPADSQPCPPGTTYTGSVVGSDGRINNNCTSDQVLQQQRQDQDLQTSLETIAVAVAICTLLI